MRKSLLMILLLGGLAGAQESGTLVQLTPAEATFVVGTQTRTYSLKGQYGALQKQGLGSIWQLHSRGKTLERAEAAGKDPAVTACLASVHQFVDRVNESKFTEAYQQLSPAQRKREDPNAFKLNYQIRYFPHEGSLPIWKVQEVKPGRIVTRVAFNRITTGCGSAGG